MLNEMQACYLEKRQLVDLRDFKLLPRNEIKGERALDLTHQMSIVERT